MFHGTGCSCCAGPQAWETFLASSSIADISRTSPSLYSTSVPNPPYVAKKAPNSWFHIPRWLLPTTRGEMAITDDSSKFDIESQSTLSMDAILKGRTRSPISLADLRNYLRGFPHLAGELIAVDFLVEFEDYKARFLALPPYKRPPHPYTVVEHLSRLKPCQRRSRSVPNIPLQELHEDLRLAHPPTALMRPHHQRSASAAAASPARSVTFHRRPPQLSIVAPGKAVDPRGGTSMNGNSKKFDPAIQALRPELEAIIDRFFVNARAQVLVDLIPPQVFSLTLSEAKLTTHPSTLERVANVLNRHLSAKILPDFLNSAVINLSRTTSTGRMIMAILALAVGVLLTAVMVIYGRGRFHRTARLCLTPVFLIALGYAIGSQTGLCFWLAWRGTREEKVYEERNKSKQVERIRRVTSGSSTSTPSHWSWKALRRAGSSLTLQSARSKKSRHGAYPPSAFRTSIYTINERGSYTLPSPRNATFLAKALRPRSFDTYYSSSPKRASRRQGWNWERAKRMMGTATSTVEVEDEMIKRAQSRIALKVTVWLGLGTIAMMTVVVCIP